MDRNSVAWSGPMPAVTTPFDASGRIDAAAFTANVERLLAAGATGIVACGCTGEFWSLSPAERVELYRLAVRAVAGRGAVILGTGAISAADTIAYSTAAKEAGADGLLILPPYFVKLSDEEIFAHYVAVDRAVSLPIMLYNIPGNAVNAVSPALAARLAGLDKVVAIKESSGDFNNFHATMIAVQDRLRVFCGPSSVFGGPAVALGADGTVDCFPNVWNGCLELYYAAREGRAAEVATLQDTGRRLTELFTTGGRTLYPATKAAMDVLGWPGGGAPRPPLQALGGAALEGLRAGMRALGVL